MQNEIGSQKWFEEKAINSIKKIGDGLWDFSDSSVLYTPQSSTAYESIQKDNTGYKKAITDTETLFIEQVAPKIVEKLPEKFTYVDLGPGTEHKERFFQNAIKTQGKEILYVPVDISKQMLDIADTFAVDAGFKTHPIHNTFEGVAESLDQTNQDYRFVSLGLTFINYEPEIILDILSKTTRGNGSSFITAQLRERVDMETVRKTYGGQIANDMINGKLQLVGINPETDISDIEVTDDVKIYVTLNKSNPVLHRLGINDGDRLLTLRSLRYSFDKLKKVLSEYDVEYYDEKSEFIGCVIN